MKYIFLNYKGRFATTIFSATQGSNVGTILQPFYQKRYFFIGVTR